MAAPYPVVAHSWNRADAVAGALGWNVGIDNRVVVCQNAAAPGGHT